MMANTLKSRLFHLFMPRAIQKIREDMAARERKYSMTVNSYESLSKNLREEIDRNHFSPYLRYEKADVSNGSSNS